MTANQSLWSFSSMTDIQEWLSEHGTGLAIGLISLGVLATQLPSIQESLSRNQAVAQLNKARLQQGRELEAQKLVLSQSEAIANGRYDKGCEVIEALQNQGTATTIQEGKPIVSGAFSHLYRKTTRTINPDHFIGRDITVCDLYGTTAIMQFDPQKGYAVAGAVAVTSDRQRMQKAQSSRPGLKRPGLNIPK
jgi:hypothetical protein